MARMSSVTIRMGDGWRRDARPEWLEGWMPRCAPLPDGDAAYVEMGEGPPLVLLPPLPGFKEAWAPVARRLARRHRVIAPDLRMRFARGTPPHAWWRMLVDDLERLCDHFGLGETAVAGHSLGGALAQHWALAHPARIRSLVLSSAFAHVTSPSGGRAARWLEQPVVVAAQRLLPRGTALALAGRLTRRYGWVYDPDCDPAVLALVRHAIRACPVHAAANAVRLAFAHDTRARLAGLRAPVRLLVGERDTAFARASARELLQRIPGATLDVAPGAGHLHPLSKPAWFSERVTSHTMGPTGG